MAAAILWCFTMHVNRWMRGYWKVLLGTMMMLEQAFIIAVYLQWHATANPIIISPLFPSRTLRVDSLNETGLESVCCRLRNHTDGCDNSLHYKILISNAVLGHHFCPNGFLLLLTKHKMKPLKPAYQSLIYETNLLSRFIFCVWKNTGRIKEKILFLCAVWTLCFLQAHQCAPSVPFWSVVQHL